MPLPKYKISPKTTLTPKQVKQMMKRILGKGTEPVSLTPELSGQISAGFEGMNLPPELMQQMGVFRMPRPGSKIPVQSRLPHAEALSRFLESPGTVEPVSPMTSPVTRVVGGVPPGSPFHAARGVGIWEQMDKPILPEDMKRVIREKTLLGMASGLDIAKHALRGAELWNTVRKHRSILGAAWREFSPKKGNMREGFLSDYVDSKIYPEFRRMKAFEANFFDTLDRMTPTQLPEQPTGVTLGSFIKGMMQK